MMKPTNEEAYQALITLQNLCFEIDSCLNCPLRIESLKSCGLMEWEPEEWEINGVSKWKAFE